MAALCHFYGLSPTEARSLTLVEWEVFVTEMKKAMEAGNG